jgi:uncharacterized protein
LLDLNVLIALIDNEHQHYQRAHEWFGSPGDKEWGTCPLTEAGLIRYVMNPAAGFPAAGLEAAIDALGKLAQRPGHRFWPITNGWGTLTADFASCIFGHEQVTDAYLLGMAIKEDGVLVTFDKGIRYLAGPQYADNVLILQ